MKPVVCLVILLLIAYLHVSGQAASERQDTLPPRSQKIILPILYYTPESSLAFGAGGQLFFRTRESRTDTRPSDLFLYCIYTLARQLSVSVKPRIFFKNETYFLNAELKHKENRYTFWGIGNETPDTNEEEYRETIGQASVALLRRLPPDFNFGMSYTYYYFKTKETEPGGLLATDETVIGRRGTQLSILGMVFNIDSRDNLYAPNRGQFMQVQTSWAADWLGSRHDYYEFLLDLRTYLPVGKSHVLALQFYTQNQFGDVPFQTTARFGGGELGRGYFRGRYLDTQMYVMQAEYRHRLHRRWKAAAFLLAGEVAPDPVSFLNDFKVAGGGGLRWQPLRKNEACVRLDFALNKEREFRWYISINEAF